GARAAVGLTYPLGAQASDGLHCAGAHTDEPANGPPLGLKNPSPERARTQNPERAPLLAPPLAFRTATGSGSGSARSTTTAGRMIRTADNGGGLSPHPRPTAAGLSERSRGVCYWRTVIRV